MENQQEMIMSFMMDVDIYIRYIRNVMNVCEEEKRTVKQLIVYLSACKQMNLQKIKTELEILRNEIGNMLYVMMESGIFIQENIKTWANIIKKVNKYYSHCVMFVNEDTDMEDTEMFESINILVIP